MSLAALDALRVRFRDRSIDDLPSVERWIIEGCPPSESMERLVHNLAGAAGTFGFSGLHAAAARIDDSLCAGSLVNPEDGLALVDALGALRSWTPAPVSAPEAD